jgi:hypothetical protein
MAMHHLEGALRLEYEVNATYNFGEQNHWELNVAPSRCAGSVSPGASSSIPRRRSGK